MLQCVAAYHTHETVCVLQCVAVSVAVCCGVLQRVVSHEVPALATLQCVAVCVAVCCSILQCITARLDS